MEEEDGDCAAVEEEDEEEAAVPVGGPPPPPPLEWSEVENGRPKGESSSGCSRAAILKGIEGLPPQQDGLDPLPLQRPLPLLPLFLSAIFLRLFSCFCPCLSSFCQNAQQEESDSLNLDQEGRKKRAEGEIIDILETKQKSSQKQRELEEKSRKWAGIKEK